MDEYQKVDQLYLRKITALKKHIFEGSTDFINGTIKYSDTQVKKEVNKKYQSFANKKGASPGGKKDGSALKRN